MIETEAQVSRAEQDYAWVVIRPHSPCGHCDPITGCKSVAISRMFGSAQQEFRVRNSVHAQAGDLVHVAVPEQTLLRSALWAYGVPLLLLLLGAMLGRLGDQEWMAMLGAGLGLMAGFLVLRLLRHAQSGLEPHIVSRADSCDASPGGCAVRCGGDSGCAKH